MISDRRALPRRLPRLLEILRFALLLTLGPVACGSDEDAIDTREVVTAAGRAFDTERVVQYALPKALREISGLDLDESGVLLAHDDEKARVYRIDYRQGTVEVLFQLGEPPVRDDFEGIASHDGTVFLVTSAGTVYQADGGDDPVRGYERYPTDLPCEIEGLAPWDATSLVAVCKHIHRGDDVLRIYLWSITDRRYLAEPLVSLGDEAFDDVVADLKKLRPSGITRTSDGGLLVVGRHGDDPVLLTLGADLRPVGLSRLPPASHHDQPEGVGLSSDGLLLIADEAGRTGDGKRRGKLSVYSGQ